MKSSNHNVVTVFILMLLPILLVGCAGMPGMPGHITESESSFDKSVQLSMEPGMVFRDNDGYSGSDLQLALFWRSTMKPGELILEAYVTGAHNFSNEKSLNFNVDGEVTSFTSIDQLTNIVYDPDLFVGGTITGGNVSSKRYLISSVFLDRLLVADDVRVKLDLGRTFVEGVFSDTSLGSAKQAFVKFIKRVEAHTN
jgi:hypothetical protein